MVGHACSCKLRCAARASSSQPSRLTAWYMPRSLFCLGTSGHRWLSVHPAPQLGQAHVGIVFSLRTDIAHHVQQLSPEPAPVPAFHSTHAEPPPPGSPPHAPTESKCPALFRHCHDTSAFLHVTLNSRGCGADGGVSCVTFRMKEELLFPKILNEAYKV